MKGPTKSTGSTRPRARAKTAKKLGQPGKVSRRVRIPKELPKPPECLEFAWAKCREHNRNADWGEVAYRVTQSPRYQATILKACDEVDRATNAPQKRAYSTAELESLNLLRRLLGKRSYRETRNWLTSDRGEKARQLLGFDQSRVTYGTKQRRLMKGIPSEATMSRHHQRFTEEAREAAWRAFFEAGREQNLKDLSREAPEELLFVPLDGSAMRIHYTAPIRKPKTGEVVNKEAITAPEAGYKAPGRDSDPDSCGHGFQDVHALIAGLPMIYDVTPMHEGEPTRAVEMLKREWSQAIAPHMPKNGKLPIFDADGGFHSQKLRQRIHELGGLPRIHHRSHSDGEKSKRAVAADRGKRWQIDGYPNWQANGLREIFCKCGKGRTFRRFGKTKSGQAVARVEGSCPKCGPISVTAGDWRRAQNPSRFIRCVYPDDYEKADWAFGNPLWFGDPIAEAYGRKRFASIEGFHGTMERRFSLIKGKRWFRRLSQAKLEVAMVYSIVHELAIQGREMAATNGHSPTGPPG